MSELDEPRVRCPKCGKHVPAMKYCIYCGTQLPPAAPTLEKPLPPQPPTPTRLPPELPPEVPPPRPPAPPQVAPAPVSIGLEGEITNLMSSITTLYERKVSILSLFRSGEVSENIFLKLYNEYNGKLNNLLNTRIRKMEEARSRLDERNKRLGEVSLDLEELEVRYKIGEVDISAFSQRAEKLKTEERELREAVKNLRMNVDRLEKIFAEKKPRETRDLEMQLRTSYDAFQKLVEEGKISAGTWNLIKPDIDETLVLFDSLMRDRKEKEKNLREQLETLQARYKLSEITIEEFERKKRELQEEIDKVWA